MPSYWRPTMFSHSDLDEAEENVRIVVDLYDPEARASMLRKIAERLIAYAKECEQGQSEARS